jgi:hypothetical protein
MSPSWTWMRMLKTAPRDEQPQNLPLYTSFTLLFFFSLYFAFLHIMIDDLMTFERPRLVS